jgi:hypothetical protein
MSRSAAVSALVKKGRAFLRREPCFFAFDPFLDQSRGRASSQKMRQKQLNDFLRFQFIYAVHECASLAVSGASLAVLACHVKTDFRLHFFLHTHHPFARKQILL